MKITADQAMDFIPRCMSSGLSVMLTSSPGMGKSDIIKQIAKEYNLELIDVRLSTIDPCELTGFPAINDGKASWVPMDIFPLENTPIPKGKHGWLLFLDETNSADLSTQKAAYKLFLDNQVGKYNLHPNVVIVGAGNLMTDNAIVSRMSTAMQTRLIHLELQISVEAWLTWAAKNKIDYRVCAYINRVPANLFKFDPRHDDKTFACPRTWEFLSKLITGIPTDDLKALLPLLAGTVSVGVATEFVNDAVVYSDLPTYPEILKAPTTAKMGKDPAALFGAAYMIAAFAVEKDMAKIMLYIQRLPTEFATICLQRLLEKDKSIKDQKDVKAWYKKIAIESL